MSLFVLSSNRVVPIPVLARFFKKCAEEPIQRNQIHRNSILLLSESENPITKNTLKLVSIVYSAAAEASDGTPYTDTNLLIGNLMSSTGDIMQNNNTSWMKYVKSIWYDKKLNGSKLTDTLEQLHGAHLKSVPRTEIDLSSSEIDKEALTRYSQVCLGGTFDDCHFAHKILLTESALLATDRVLIGLASDDLLKNKKLKELIASGEDRRKALKDFFELILMSSSLKVEIPLITDPAGPAGWDGSLECIVLSKETEKGGEYCNRLRREKGLKELAVHVINDGKLLEDGVANAEMGEEGKVSSSSLRLRKLGTLVKNPENALVNSKTVTGALRNTSSTGNGHGADGHAADAAHGANGHTVTLSENRGSHAVIPDCYILGLTGGSGCGKSSIAKYLGEHGCFLVDCDKIGKGAYATPHSDCWNDLVAHFGVDKILADDGSEQVDRHKLCGIVFADKNQLEKLNQIVWPHIEKACREEIKKYVASRREEKKGTKIENAIPPIVVLDAAVLLQANWACDEVWVTFVSREEQIKRIVERDGKTEERAAARVDSQPPHEQVIPKAHVLLTTTYEPKITAEIVKKAHGLLVERLEAGVKSVTGNVSSKM